MPDNILETMNINGKEEIKFSTVMEFVFQVVKIFPLT